MKTYTQRLFEHAQPIYQAILADPFVNGIGQGDLPQHARDYYVAQDHYYCEQFMDLFDRVDALLPADVKAQKPVSTQEDVAHQALKPSVAWQQVQPDMHNLVYLEHMNQAIQTDPLAGMLALQPCTESYHLIGTHLAQQTAPQNPLQGWIDYYTHDFYRNFNQWSTQTIDQLGGNQDIDPQHLEIYLKSYQYELEFWQQASQRI
ncbi:MAG: TenA family protein [Lactobacillaceae bacterium]|jgi:thiaminase/transcriptional activator TenA|nr:TenA family protein [Lactobacillaceae bacterium]